MTDLNDTAGNNTNVIIPSSPADRKQIRTMLEQMVNCLVRMDSERAAKKEISDEIHEKFGIPKKLINKMARTMHKHNFGEVAAEQADFEALYEQITSAK